MYLLITIINLFFALIDNRKQSEKPSSKTCSKEFAVEEIMKRIMCDLDSVLSMLVAQAN